MSECSLRSKGYLLKWFEEDSPLYLEEVQETGRIYRGHFNVKNGGAIENLPSDAIVELPCYVDKSNISVQRLFSGSFILYSFWVYIIKESILI